MMQYLLNATRKGAEALSQRIAREQGAATVDHVTQFWFGVDEADDGEALLMIPAGQQRLLRSAESATLLSERPAKFAPSREIDV